MNINPHGAKENAAKNIALKPFVKWAGGKRQLLGEIRKNLPPDISCRTYYEPFIGGGALFFDLRPGKAVINDSNPELMLAYKIIRDHAEDLISALAKHQAHYSVDYYYEVRALDRDPAFQHLSGIEKAARFIFLNKTCYNGLYRVSSRGVFNVPAGKHKSLNICERALLENIGGYLNSADITVLNTDFAEAVSGADACSFVYFDPPYHSLSKTGFSSYRPGGFTEGEQIRLRDLYLRLTAQGIPCLLSNADTSFIRDIYRHSSIRIIPVTARRMINSDPGGRGSADEVLIKNYE